MSAQDEINSFKNARLSDTGKEVIDPMKNIENALQFHENEIKKVRVYDTMALAQADTNLVVGDVIETLGYHQKNDGGGHGRKVSSTDNGTGIPYNGMWLIIPYKKQINALSLGCVGDGVFDNLPILQKLMNSISDYKGLKIKFPIGDFFISNTLNIRYRCIFEGVSIANVVNSKLFVTNSVECVKCQDQGIIIQSLFLQSPITSNSCIEAKRIDNADNGEGGNVELRLFNSVVSGGITGVKAYGRNNRIENNTFIYQQEASIDLKPHIFIENAGNHEYYSGKEGGYRGHTILNNRFHVLGSNCVGIRNYDTTDTQGWHERLYDITISGNNMDANGILLKGHFSKSNIQNNKVSRGLTRFAHIYTNKGLQITGNTIFGEDSDILDSKPCEFIRFFEDCIENNIESNKMKSGLNEFIIFDKGAYRTKITENQCTESGYGFSNNNGSFIRFKSGTVSEVMIENNMLLPVNNTKINKKILFDVGVIKEFVSIDNVLDSSQTNLDVSENYYIKKTEQFGAYDGTGTSVVIPYKNNFKGITVTKLTGTGAPVTRFFGIGTGNTNQYITVGATSVTILHADSIVNGASYCYKLETAKTNSYNVQI